MGKRGMVNCFTLFFLSVLMVRHFNGNARFDLPNIGYENYSHRSLSR